MSVTGRDMAVTIDWEPPAFPFMVKCGLFTLRKAFYLTLANQGWYSSQGLIELPGPKGVSISRKKPKQGDLNAEIPYFCCPKREIILLSSVG